MPLLALVVLEIMTVPSHQTTLHLIHFHRVIYVRDLACLSIEYSYFLIANIDLSPYSCCNITLRFMVIYVYIYIYIYMYL